MKRLIVLALIALPLCAHAFEYSFLNNPTTLNFAVELLRSEGIAEANITVWTNEVARYNRRVAFFAQNNGGWLRSDRVNAVSDSSFFSPPYVNCRIGLFLLVHDLMSVTKYYREPQTASHINRECSGITNEFSITAAEIAVYKSAFNPVTLPLGEVTEGMFDIAMNYIEQWRTKEGLKFPSNPRLRIMQAVIVRPQTKFAFADHVGLIIDNDRGLFLIEKLGPYNPFIISKFRDYDEMGEYLYQTFADWSECGVMILANDEVVWKKVNR